MQCASSCLVCSRLKKKVMVGSRWHPTLMCWRAQGLDDHIVALEVRAEAASSHIQVVVRRLIP
jgi:hypothetical protein